MPRRDRRGMHASEDHFVRSILSIIDYASINRALFTGIGIAILIGVAAVFAYRGHLRAYNQKAEVAFEAARTAEQFRDVAETFPGTDVEPWALFYYGRKLIDDKKYQDALAVFSSLSEKTPKGLLAPSARILEAMLFEQQALFQDAARSYESLVERYPGSYVAPRALINMGTCYEKLGEIPKARAAYERLLSDYAGSPWAKEAEERTSMLEEPAGEGTSKERV